MFDNSTKKLIILFILQILINYSDENNKLTQKEIQIILEKEYEIKVDRKTIKRNLSDLIDNNYPIEYVESKRKNARGDIEDILTDFYYCHEFTTSEIQLLIDSLLSFKNTPHNQINTLISKLCNLTSKKQKFSYPVIKNSSIENKQLLFTIDVIKEAINENCKVSFNYNNYGIDKRLHIKCDSNEVPITYTIIPLQLAVLNGRYYLLCRRDGSKDIYNYRIDRITEIKKLNLKFKTAIDDKSRIDLPKHMKEHIYMFTGKSERVTFLADKHIINDILDWFGYDVSLRDADKKMVEVSVVVNMQAMKYWALQYLDYVEIISPKQLIADVQKSLKNGTDKYNSK